MADPRAPNRAELSAVFKDQRTLKAFERIFDLIPGDLESFVAELASIPGKLADIEAQSSALRDELSRVAGIRDQLDDIRSHELAHLESLISQVREGQGMKLKRLIRNTITLAPASGSGTYTISPECNTSKTVLIPLGSNNSNGGAAGEVVSRVELTNSATVTAYRGVTSGTDVVGFQLVEYE